jgi:beta-glucosidase
MVTGDRITVPLFPLSLGPWGDIFVLMRPGLSLILSTALVACAGTKRDPVAPPPAPKAVTSVTAPTDTPRVAPRARIDVSVDSILALMTLEEKAGQLNQIAGTWEQGVPRMPRGADADVRAGRIGSFLGIFGAEYTREMQRIAVTESRLKIPLLLGHDVIHGFRTIFPLPLAEAASWDPEAVERAARIAAIEATAAGLHWTFAPMVDIARDPRWGRIVEGSGEDPYLGSVMAAARVRGFQGSDLSLPNTMLATAKHYVAYGAAEAGRDYNTTDVSERVLREVYLPPFHAAVLAGAESIMGAFNEISGIPMHAHEFLMQDVLRREWGWDGLFVSDWTAIQEMIAHGIASNAAEASVAAMRVGVDMDMMSRFYLNELPKLVRSGTVPEADVNTAVRRVLKAKYKLGLFDDPYRYSNVEREKAVTLAPEHIRLAREMARKSIVLLKNQRNTLPLRTLGSVALIGVLADTQPVPLGTWAAAGRAEDVVTIHAALRNALEPHTRLVYRRGVGITSMDTSGFAAAVRAARSADVVIMVVGEHHDMTGEAYSRSTLELPGVQLDLVKRVHALGKPVVVVLMGGRPLSINWIDENIPAILETWFLGVQMGPAVVDVLFGTYNPSGKLPVTFPRTVGQVPIYYNAKNTGRPPDPNNRYTSKYQDVPWTPLYPFGHGLSYTTFTYGQPTVGAASIRATDSVTVSVPVTNSGSRAGEEVVQLYIRDDVASVTRPVKELRGFRKISLVPGASQTVSFVLRPDDLAFYNREMKRVVEPGTFTVFVGGSSADTKQAKFTVVP